MDFEASTHPQSILVRSSASHDLILEVLRELVQPEYEVLLEHLKVRPECTRPKFEVESSISGLELVVLKFMNPRCEVRNCKLDFVVEILRSSSSSSNLACLKA